MALSCLRDRLKVVWYTWLSTLVRGAARRRRGRARARGRTGWLRFARLRRAWAERAQVLMIAFVISALAAAAQSPNGAFKFACVWSALLGIAFAAGGTYVLRKGLYKDAVLLGAMMGVAAWESMLLLVLAVLAGSASTAVVDVTASTAPGHKATVFFAVLLFLLYATYSAMLFQWQDDLLAATVAPPADHEAAMPPPRVPEFPSPVAGADVGVGYTGKAAYDTSSIAGPASAVAPNAAAASPDSSGVL